MSDIEITWRGLTIGGDSDVDVHSITGWDDLDAVDDRLDEPRARGHGDHPGELYSRARIVTARGEILTRSARDQLALAVQAATPVASSAGELAVTTFGRRLTAGARLIRRSVPVEDDYASGRVPFTLQWKCPDPLRYGPELSAETGLPTSGTGLTYPLAYPLDYGTPGATGRITLANDGTADAGIQLAVRGALPEGWEVSAGGDRLRYPTPVPAGQVIDIDTDTGSVLVEGTADRRGELTIADWILVPAGGEVTLQFTSLGGAYDPAARLTARWKPASW
jgi:hypothetical protein